MGAGLIAGAVAAVLIAWNMECVKRIVQEQVRRHQNERAEQDVVDADAVAAEAAARCGEEEPPPPRYESLKDLHRRAQRRVRFASANTIVEYQPRPSPWFNAFYGPNRPRFETTIVDGVYMRHGFSSSSHSIEGV